MVLKGPNLDDVIYEWPLIEESFNPIFPRGLITDRGSSVSSKHITELLHALNAGITRRNQINSETEETNSGKTVEQIPPIKQYLSTPYYPLSHSQIERWFSTFSQSLRRLIREYPQTWANYAGRICQVLNNMRSITDINQCVVMCHQVSCHRPRVMSSATCHVIGHVSKCLRVYVSECHHVT